MSSTQQSRVPCGTPGGYRRHIRRREDTCEPCRAAHRLHTAERRRQANPDMKPYRAAIEHGTYKGYRTELRRGLETCAPCRAAAVVTRSEGRQNQAARKEELEEYRDAVLILRADLAPLIAESNTSVHRPVRVAATSVMAAVVQLQTAVAALISEHHAHPRRNR
jgi:hypothetical protein